MKTNNIKTNSDNSEDENTVPIKLTGTSEEDNTVQIPTRLPSENGTRQEEGSPSPPPAKKVKKRRGLIILTGIGVVVLLTVIGGFIGYRVAYNSRLANAQEEAAYEASTQFLLGVADIEAGRYEIAKQRFEFVLQTNPDFPGVLEKYTEVMLIISQQKTPTQPLPTPTFAPTATKDLRPVEDLYTTAQAFLRAGDWNNAIVVIEALRTADLAYRAIDVDGMYYIALRGRGIQKILQEGNLEGGIYDLSLVQKFGPLDREAEGYRAWARAYLQGASFWKVDWEKVVSYFSQIYPAVPSLRDIDGWTAAERYRIALIEYGNKFLAAENYCAARDQFRIALSIADDLALAPTATFVQLQCEPPTPTLAPATSTPEFTPILPTSETPVDTPPPLVESPTP